MRFSVVLPAWNEAKTIERAVRETARVFSSFGDFEIIVVDDGSTDATSEIAIRSGARVVCHEQNQGKGAAVRTGVRASTGKWIIFLDADLSVTPDQFAQFLPALASSDIVIGSRRVLGAEIPEPQPMARDFSGRLFNVLIRWMTGLPYRDTQCGFKAFHERTKKLFEDLRTSGWSFDVELLVRARASGLRVTEVPVVWRNGNESRVRWTDAARVLKEVWRIRRDPSLRSG